MKTSDRHGAIYRRMMTENGAQNAPQAWCNALLELLDELHPPALSPPAPRPIVFGSVWMERSLGTGSNLKWTVLSIDCPEHEGWPIKLKGDNGLWNANDTLLREKASWVSDPAPLAAPDVETIERGLTELRQAAEARAEHGDYSMPINPRVLLRVIDARAASEAQVEALKTERADLAHTVVDALLEMYRIYPNYRVDTRGPVGLIRRSIAKLWPAVDAYINEHGDINAAQYHFFHDDDGGVRQGREFSAVEQPKTDSERPILVGSQWSGDCREPTCQRRHVVKALFQRGGRASVSFKCGDLIIRSSEARFRREHGWVSEPPSTESPLCKCSYPESWHTDEKREYASVCKSFEPASGAGN